MKQNENNAVLDQFFKNYEAKAIEYYQAAYIKVQEIKADYETAYNNGEIDRRTKYNGTLIRSAELVSKALASDFVYAQSFDHLMKYRGLEDAIKKETKRKRANLIDRIEKKVGTITELKDIQLDVNGNINGYVKGTNGSAYIETIGAGGYNIQRYHYRTLVK